MAAKKADRMDFGWDTSSAARKESRTASRWAEWLVLQKAVESVEKTAAQKESCSAAQKAVLRVAHWAACWAEQTVLRMVLKKADSRVQHLAVG